MAPSEVLTTGPILILVRYASVRGRAGNRQTPQHVRSPCIFSQAEDRRLQVKISCRLRQARYNRRPYDQHHGDSTRRRRGHGCSRQGAGRARESCQGAFEHEVPEHSTRSSKRHNGLCITACGCGLIHCLSQMSARACLQYMVP